MTGEVSPGTGAGSGDRPELRASHDDRDRAVEILRVAAGDGRLTAAELDERVEAALTARTSAELAALRPCDIDLDTCTIRVVRQLIEQLGGGSAFGPPKSRPAGNRERLPPTGLHGP